MNARLCAILLILATPSLAADFYLKSGDRVVFYGDSITDQRLYTTFAETYVVTRFPTLPVTFVHSGWGGDRVTGGGGGPIDLRLQRDVSTYQPTVMTIMLGMNDGQYKAFDESIFKTFANGYEHIIEAMKTAAPSLRFTVIQPSPYDDVTRKPIFEPGYNATLVRYSQFLQELSTSKHLEVADLNTPVVDDLRKANALNPELAPKIIPDRIHPGAAGHLLMAEALLKAWNAPALVSAVEIDVAKGTVIQTRNTEVASLDLSGPPTWTQTDKALPFPIDWNDRDKLVPLVMQASDFVDALDQELLKVNGLKAERYSLMIDGVEAAMFTREQLAAGINLATLPNTPMMKQAAEVHRFTLQHTATHQYRWRNIQVPLEKDNLPNKEASMAALDKLEEDMIKAQRAAAQPKPHRFELAALHTEAQ
jgi:lysophospholipase L1-like esterase